MMGATIMKCIKCGKERIDDFMFCPNCGKKFVSVSIRDYINKIKSDPRLKKKLGVALVAICLIIIFIEICNFIKQQSICSLDSCDNDRRSNSYYCSSHSCEVDNCMLSKSKSDKYCSLHNSELLCYVDNCKEPNYGGSKYCQRHVCDESNCLNEAMSTTGYCSEHTIDVKERLDNLKISYSKGINHAVEFLMTGKNISGKDIKSLSFVVLLFDKYGNRTKEYFTDCTYIFVDTKTYITKNKKFTYGKKTIGNSIDCDSAKIESIIITYADDTSENVFFLK